MTKFVKAKRLEHKAWREILRDLPKLTRIGFHEHVHDKDSGFCKVYRIEDNGRCVATECPMLELCSTMTRKEMNLCEEMLIHKTLRYWRKPAADLCRWMLREVDKV